MQGNTLIYLPAIKKIVIITSGQPSLNPRLVKEADALSAAGYSVSVLYAYWNEWGTEYDRQLLAGKKWEAIRVGGDPKQKRLTYFISRLLQKLAGLMVTKFKAMSFAEMAISRGSFFLSREAKKHKADLYIGHNLGALPATVKAAKTNKKPCGFDAEDFHRFELTDDTADLDVKLKTFIEDNFIPQTDYLSTSSPLISEAYQKLYPQKKQVTLLNVFPLDKSVREPVINESGPVKLFWFSQTIGINRGIEDIVKALQLLKSSEFELHLLGFITAEGKKKFIGQLQPGNVKLYFHDPISPDELISFASQFDIGLATEKSEPFNRDICLTNKIFTYMQSGLAIIASDTAAQTELMRNYPLAGKVYKKGNTRMIADTLADYSNNREKLLGSRKASLYIGQTELNWEKESPKLLHTIEDTFRNSARNGH